MPDELTTVEFRTWTNSGAPDETPSLVRLSADFLTLANVPAADLEAVLADLESGGDVAAHVIPLDHLAGAEGEEDGAKLTITYRTGPTKQESKEVAFADRAARDDFAATLAGTLGPGWLLDRRATSRWTAGFWTLVPTAIAALIAWGLHAEATRIAQGKPPVNWGRGKLRLPAFLAHWVEQTLGPVGVLAAGGVLVAVGLGLFALVMAWPPMNVVIERADAA